MANLATANLSDGEHEQFLSELNQVDWHHCVTVTREGGTTTVVPRFNKDLFFLSRSLRDGHLSSWGSKFTQS